MDDLFEAMYVPPVLREAVSGRAWVQAMLDFEAALARAVAPPEAAEAIAAECRAERFDVGELANAARATGNPAAPLVARLTDIVGGEAAGWVHTGATSQDVLDSAEMLVARRALSVVDSELTGVAGECARLAEEHRDTPMAARTLLQQALPTTFGLKVAGWLSAVLAARRRLRNLPLAVQLGGAAGTLASLGPEGPAAVERVAEALGLGAPELPWHSDRGRVGELGAALVLAAGAAEKAGLDLVLLAQTEVGEVAEAAGRGGSSTLPQKRNPVGAAMTIACARRVRGEASVLLAAAREEHERGAGGWQSEWQAVSEALAATGGAAWALREALEGLEVRPARMRENLEAEDGAIMAEAATTALAPRLGRHRAHELVGRAVRSEEGLRAGLAGELSEEELDAALDPACYLGSTGTFVDRALMRWREEQ
jgi:3-carboxy-cis,cis-muconate cycloisomerase